MHAKLDIEAYLLPQIDSLNIRDNVKKFKPKDVSQDYKYWTNLIIDQCKKNDWLLITLWYFNKCLRLLNATHVILWQTQKCNNSGQRVK